MFVASVTANLAGWVRALPLFGPLSLLLDEGAAEAPGSTTAALPEAAAATPDFQPYIFWAYGLACLLLLGFTLWTFAEARAVRKRIDYLTDRFARAHPGMLPGEET